MADKKPSVLIAFGGNALDVGNSPDLHQKEEFIVARRAMTSVVDCVQAGYDQIILTHGNGPQVGRIFLQQELTKEQFPRQITLDVCVADSQGRIGYVLQNVFDNLCKQKGLNKTASTVVTQVVVDKADPAFQKPNKPIGLFYKEEEAKKLIAERAWNMTEDAGRGWRRIVPSPIPRKIVEEDKILKLVNSGFMTIACGGGGIPVIENEQGELRGVEAVIDKDRTSALLAANAKVDVFVILTEANFCYINYKKPNELALQKVKYSEMEKFQKEGHFLAGSMGPKVEAAMEFIRKGGKRSIIANLYDLLPALNGQCGTEIVPD